MDQSIPAAGRLAKIRAHGYEATVGSVGASLRSLTFENTELVVCIEDDVTAPAFHGAILAPWPNRLDSGEYSWDGVAYRAALNEPERSNANHGLAAWLDWELLDHSEAAMRWGVTVPAQAAYPSALRVEARYEVGDSGLSWGVSATNIGTRPAPYGVATHPYLTAASGVVDDWDLTIPATKVLEASESRLLPVALHAVEEYEGGDYDFRELRRVARSRIDHAFTGVVPGFDGFARVGVTDENGQGAELFWDPKVLPWVQAFTADLGKPDFPDRTGIAVEAMSCPADAFNSGTDLVRLEPGATHTASWHIRAVR